MLELSAAEIHQSVDKWSTKQILRPNAEFEADWKPENKVYNSDN